ncbi:hypothetical protein Tco_0520541 [Tanacetum coccineum]
MNIPGSKFLSLFPKGNETKRSISENSSEKVKSQSDRRRGKSLSSGLEEADQSKDQNEMIHIPDEKDQNEKWYCHYSSLRYCPTTLLFNNDHHQKIENAFHIRREIIQK